MSYANELRAEAAFHEEQAASLARDSHLDALLSLTEEASAAEDRKRAIDAHMARARALSAEAEQQG